MNFAQNYDAYQKKIADALKAHNIAIVPEDWQFSGRALSAAEAGDWDMAAGELRDVLQKTLGHQLSTGHQFVAHPYVRRIAFPDQGSISVTIVNEQSREWYGSEQAVHAFDFLLEAQRGIFCDCRRFLDLGGHQLIWACFYAMSAPDARVVSYEPSILNVAIGLFNSLVNGVVERVQVVPFAALASNAPADDGEYTKMLVDFMIVPLRGRRIEPFVDEPFDFIKTDIEGYEFELLNDPVYLDLLGRAKSSHLELHLGHLSKRGINLQQLLDLLHAADIRGTELNSMDDAYDFLESCDPDGFYAFIVNRPGLVGGTNS